MKQQHKPALLMLVCISLTLLAGLLFALPNLTPQLVHAQEDAESGITAPASGSFVNGTISIVGTATDPAFQRYEVYAKPSDADETAYVFIEGGEEAVTNGPLAVWETDELEPGLYDLRLRVVRIDGNYDEYFVTGLQVGQIAETPTTIATTPAATTVVTTVATALPTDTATDTATVTATAELSPTATASVTTPVSPTETPTEEPTEEPTAEPTEAPAEPQVVAINTINVRAGPSTDFDIVGSLDAGESAPITGQNEAGDWWQIEFNDGSGWVLGRLVTAENATDIAVVEAPLGPDATPTATPAATEAPTTTVEPASEATEVSSVSAESTTEFAMVAPLASGGVVTVTLAGNTEDPAALRAFLSPVLAGFGPSETTITATIGLLPENLPISLTVPSTATVLGSVVRTGDFGGSQLFLSTEEEPEALVEEVRQQLLDAGFTAPPQSTTGGGPGAVFLSNDPLFGNATLCSPDEELSLTLGTVTLSGETEVVSLSTSPVSPFGGLCSQSSTVGSSDPFSVLPALSPPAEAQVQGSGGGSGGGSGSLNVSAEAEIETSLSVADLAAHYEEQLQDAGWERLDDTGTYATSWSAWSFEDEAGNTWNATFYIVLQSGEENGYLASLRAETQQ